MGNSNSSTSTNKSTSDLQNQLSFLGNRLPFGDEEIIRIARCFIFLNRVYQMPPTCEMNSMQEQQQASEASNHIHFFTKHITHRFLTDWAVFASTLPPPDSSTYHDLLQEDANMFEHSMEVIHGKRANIHYILEIIEEHILPKHFGQEMYQHLFALLIPESALDASFSTNHDPWKMEVQNSTNMLMKRIEKFLNGVALTTRRGSRAVLTSIYQCCISQGQDQAEAKDLLDLFYRIALSNLAYDSYFAYLESINNIMQTTEEEEEGMDGDHHADDCSNADAQDSIEKKNISIKPFDPTKYYPQDMGVRAAQSLIHFSNYYHHTEHSSSAARNDNTASEYVSLDSFLGWAEKNAPCLSAVVESFMHRIFFPDKPYPPSRTEFSYPSLRGQQSAFFKECSSPLLFLLASMSNSLGGAWQRLYTSDSDGLSFNRLQNALLGYSGPTLLIIKEADGGGIFGAMTNTAWKESKNFYGNSDCFLFQLHPNVAVMRPRGVGENFMYCNSYSRSRGYDGQSHGIGFGGTTDKPRLFIAENWDDCLASSADLTFEPGALLPERNDGNPSKVFDLESLEVWGIGGDEAVALALGDRHKQREVTAANIRKARKVDKAQFVDDLAQFGSKTFQHRDQIRGRADCHVSNKDIEDYIPDYGKS